MVEIEHTPNPDTLKFLPQKKVSEVGPVEFLKNDKSIKIPLVNNIFSLNGITMVFLGADFITVKKEKDLKGLKGRSGQAERARPSQSSRASPIEPVCTPAVRDISIMLFITVVLNIRAPQNLIL